MVPVGPAIGNNAIDGIKVPSEFKVFQKTFYRVGWPLGGEGVGINNGDSQSSHFLEKRYTVEREVRDHLNNVRARFGVPADIEHVIVKDGRAVGIPSIRQSNPMDRDFTVAFERQHLSDSGGKPVRGPVIRHDFL